MIKTVGLFFLLLLKVLGWTLLVLLMFLTAVLLLVLFVPVRYDVRVQNERSMEPGQNHPAANLRLQLKASWLLHLLHVSVSYGQEGMHYKIRAAGVDIPEMLAKLAKRKERKKKRREAEKKKSSRKKSKSRTIHAEADTEESGQLLEKSAEADTQTQIPLSEDKSAEETQAQRQSAEEESAEDTQAQRQSAEKSPENGEKASRPHRKKEPKRHNARKAPKPKAEKRVRKPKKEEPGIIDRVRTQFGRLHKEVTDEANRHAVSCLWKELLKLLQRYKPRRLKADLAFSLADPALTGAVTGMISLLPLIYRYPCSIIPDFTSDKLYIEGEIQADGKVTVCIFVLSLLRLLRDKVFMQTVRRLLKRNRT